MTENSGNVLTIEELADYLKISKSTLYKLAQNGVLPGIKVGRHWRFHKDAVDEWLKNHPNQLSKEETKEKAHG
ncbi:MAG: DNA-binding protein [Planctomycetota bacterium]|nr:MAG: DNA-binding protein [Planctomycetota bacterium]